jgi:hypothetical protein
VICCWHGLAQNAQHQHDQLQTLPDDSAGYMSGYETRDVHRHLGFRGERGIRGAWYAAGAFWNACAVYGASSTGAGMAIYPTMPEEESTEDQASQLASRVSCDSMRTVLRRGALVVGSMFYCITRVTLNPVVFA